MTRNKDWVTESEDVLTKPRANFGRDHRCALWLRMAISPFENTPYNTWDEPDGAEEP